MMPTFTNTPILSHHKYPHLMMMLALLFLMLSLLLFQTNESFILEWNLTTINSAIISFPIILEKSSTLFMFTVSFISFNVLLFSKVYMLGDINLHRFTQMVMSFITSMMLLILCPNIMMMLLGWDGLGITSFLLVIYFQNNRSLKSGFITLITNRIGDCLILLAIAIIMSQGQWNMMNTWADAVIFTDPLALLILMGAMTKSAQFPFMGWLTCAMAAPTPVSALVHSSTLVTAGVFLLIRFYPFLSQFTYFTPILMWAGTITMFLAASWAMTKKDMKETIALSTMSQLGLMMTTLSMGMTNWCFFHLITHAMFKATMFMSAGMVITFKSHRQSFSNINLKTHSRTSAVAMMSSLISMNAIFFMAGYYSKDTILETIWYNSSMFMWVLFFMVSTMMTAIYSLRLWRSVISDSISHKSSFRKSINHHSIKSHLMNNQYKPVEIPMMLMTVASTTMGATTSWLLTNPSDSPIAPVELEILAPLMVISGILFASWACPTNKMKSFTKTIKKSFTKIISTKSMNQKKSKKPAGSFLGPYLYTLLGKTTFPVITMTTTGPLKNIISHMSTMKLMTRPGDMYVHQTYMLAKPFMVMSFYLDKVLDMGAYKLLGPSLLPSMTSTATSPIMKFQSSSITQILSMILLFMLLSLPLIL